jgi:EAL domain-containing protein (putative c-di-GMP-specific phosphodiesterase class I)
MKRSPEAGDRDQLQRALERDELRVHYQPIVSAAGEELVGFEALVRWAHPERGLLRAAEFIPLAEQTGMVRSIGHRVLLEAARQCSAWQARYEAPGLRMAVNISAPELAAPDLQRRIVEILAESSLAAADLILEINARALVSSTDVTLAKLPLLRDLGVQLALDGFVPGAPPLSELREQPVDIVKIAKSSLDGVPESEQDTQAVREVIELAHTLGLEVVGEGVERNEQLTTLQELGCDLVQGYLLARPQSSERIQALLENIEADRASEPGHEPRAGRGFFRLGPAPT